MKKSTLVLTMLFLSPTVLIAIVVGATWALGQFCSGDEYQDEEQELLKHEISPPRHAEEVAGKDTDAKGPLKVDQIFGRYEGRADKECVQTEFFRNASGELGGRYSSSQDGAAYQGQLDHAILGKEHDVAFIWHDRYGAGPVHFLFNSDGSAFCGEWKTVPPRSMPVYYRISTWMIERYTVNSWSGKRSNSVKPVHSNAILRSGIQTKEKLTDKKRISSRAEQ
jgi:hypothetical protein